MSNLKPGDKIIALRDRDDRRVKKGNVFTIFNVNNHYFETECCLMGLLKNEGITWRKLNNKVKIG